MNETLKQLFKSLAPFNDEELALAAQYLEYKKIPRNAYFSKAGLISDNIGFVSSGLLRSFYTVNQKETTTFFLTSGSVAAALLSFVRQQPAIENIQAINDSELLLIHRKNLHKLYHENWKWQQVGRILVENYYVRMEQRSIVLLSQSAKEKYAHFLREYPELIKTVPLQYIASYLGVTPETLSRVRKSMLFE